MNYLLSLALNLIKPLFGASKIFLVVLFFSFGSQTYADSIAGGEITWLSLGRDTLEVTATVYRNCNGHKMAALPITLTSSCGTKTYATSIKSSQNITPVCAKQCTPCNSSSCTFKYGFEAYEMSTIIVTTDLRKKGCCNVRLSITNCCRGGYITTGARSQSFYVESAVNICTNDLGFVDWNNKHADLLCLGQDFIGQNSLTTGHKEDSVVYSFSDPQIANGRYTTWSSGFSSQKFLTFLAFPKSTLPFPRGLHLDSNSGSFMFRPMREETTIYVVKAEIYRKGVLIGITKTDRLITVVRCPNNNPPVLTGIDYSIPRAENFVVKACANQEICFGISAYDKDSADSITLSLETAIEGIKITHLNPGSKYDSIQFCWTPSDADVSNQPYFVNVRALDNACPINGVTSRRFQVYVQASPKAEFTHEINDCGNVLFKSKVTNSQPVVAYSWNYRKQTVNRNNTAARDSQVMGLLASGRQVVNTSVIGKNGCVLDYSDTVIMPNNFIQALRTPDTVVCEGSTVDLKAAISYPTGKFKLKWSTGDSSLTSTGATKIKVGAVDTFVVLWLKDSTCSKIDTIKIKVKGLPRIKLQKQVVGCAGDTLIIQSINPDSHQIVSYRWYHNKLLMSKANDSTFLKVIEPGSYQLITQDDLGCTHVDSGRAIVKKPIDRGDYRRTACDNSPVTLRLPHRSNGSYFWYLGNTDTSKAPDYSLQDSIVGTFQKGLKIGVLLIDTEYGMICRSLDSIVIDSLYPVVNAGLKATTDSVCESDDLEFTSNVSGGEWRYESQVSQADKLVFQPSVLGDGQVDYRFTDGNGCTYKESADYYVAEVPKPEFDVSDTLFKGISFTAIVTDNFDAQFDYFWSVGSPVFATFNGYSPGIKIDSIGTFKLKLDVVNQEVGCRASFEKQLGITLATGTNDIQNQIMVYPNPSDGLLRVEGLGSKVSEYSVWSTTGRLVSKGTVPHIDLRNEPAGIYLLQVLHGNEILQKTIVIE